MTLAPARGKPLADLGRVYAAIAEWLLYPEEIDPATLEVESVEETLSAARAIDSEVEQRLRVFLSEREAVDAESYVALFDLNPRYPLYLGAHQFDEPTTCSQAGMSDRNTYMLEVANIYRHFAIELHTELPDYLPAMTEFLAISAACPPADDEVRVRLIERLMIEGVRRLGAKLGESEVPHRHLVAALTRCLELEVEAAGELDLVAAAGGGEGLGEIRIEEVPGRG